jgi:alpha-methylacyl-CoA racemase
MTPRHRTGPLSGVRVLELANLAPAPFACMLLADLGADVLRIDRPGMTMAPTNPLCRGTAGVELDLKRPENVEAVLQLVGAADVLVEGFRPGVAERLGIGPEVCSKVNPRLVYSRITGWGQSGPLAAAAGHDINFVALSGALHAIGPADHKPVPPVNFMGDFAGGGLVLAFGIVSALLERSRSGFGQVVDAAMVEGAALFTATMHGMLHDGRWSLERGKNTLDGGAPFYDTYETADHQYVAVGAMEPKFYASLLRGLGLAEEALPDQWNRSTWPDLRVRLAAAFKTRTRDAWTRIFVGLDACVAPVLSPAEAPAHPHAVARGSFVEVAGVTQPRPAPRFSRTPAAPPSRATRLRDVRDALTAWEARDG